MEALQFVFGEEAIKVVGQGMSKATKLEVNLGKGAHKLEKGVKLVERATEIDKGTDKLLPGAFNRFSKFEKHFGKHAKEWGGITKEAYYKRAITLMESSVSGDILGFTNSAGYTFRMNIKTAEFGIMRPDGMIETFYRRLNNSSAYWAEQVAKYGK